MADLLYETDLVAGCAAAVAFLVLTFAVGVPFWIGIPLAVLVYLGTRLLLPRPDDSRRALRESARGVSAIAALARQMDAKTNPTARKQIEQIAQPGPDRLRANPQGCVPARVRAAVPGRIHLADSEGAHALRSPGGSARHHGQRRPRRSRAGFSAAHRRGADLAARRPVPYRSHRASGRERAGQHDVAADRDEQRHHQSAEEPDRSVVDRPPLRRHRRPPDRRGRRGGGNPARPRPAALSAPGGHHRRNHRQREGELLRRREREADSPQLLRDHRRLPHRQARSPSSKKTSPATISSGQAASSRGSSTSKTTAPLPSPRPSSTRPS